MDVSSVVLHKLLSEGDLEAWSKLKLVYIDPAFSGLYSAISRHYEKYGELPTFDTIELVSRETATTKTLEILRLAEVPDVSIDVALDALVDQYTQNETIKLLDKFLDKLPSYDTTEVKENLSSIVLTLDEKTYSAEGVYDMGNILLFKQPEELANLRFHLGLNNTFDSVLGGVAREEYILIGGTRGSGKSITAANICVNQYEAGHVCPYFTIEMNGHETLERIMAIAAKVSHNNIKKGTLSPDEILALIQTRANMFQDSQHLVTEFLTHRNRYKFEEELVRHCKLKEDNQIIIVDDRHLSLVSLDLHLGKIKSKFGDKFTVAVVDYINQIVIDGQDKYDWKVQIAISSKLKELARKYEIIIVSPYQLDANGETRFSKGILDSADIALVMSAGESSMTFNTTKIRSDGEMKFTSGINWETLRISPTPLESSEEPKKIKRAGKETSKQEQEPEAQDDELPWN